MSAEKPAAAPAGPSGVSERIHAFAAEQRITSSLDDVGVRWLALQAALQRFRALEDSPQRVIADAAVYEAYLRTGEQG